MKRITKIRIPKGKYCGWRCRWLDAEFSIRTDKCFLFKKILTVGVKNKKWITLRCPQCLKMFPNGAVFELKEKK